MYLCYIDESGTSEPLDNTSHFVLAGLAIPIRHWKQCDTEIETIKRRYSLANAEIHTAWLLRKYIEQTKVSNFDSLDYKPRRSQVESIRKAELLRLQRGNTNQYHQTRKNYRNTQNYIHLSYHERKAFILQIANCLASWNFARLFAECIDKVFFDPARSDSSIDQQSFEQVVSRFEQFLQIYTKPDDQPFLGLLIHDNNQTVATKHTQLMRKFHQSGTLWTKINNIIETPLFVDSQLTSMVQVSDLCAFALRRYLEAHEEDLFDCVFQRADRKEGVVVGVRHFTNKSCTCKICAAHKKPTTPQQLPLTYP